MRKTRFSDDECREIGHCYAAGKSLRELAETFNASVVAIVRALKVAGVNARKFKSNERYSFDESFFDNVDTERKAYWVGFLAADGYISSRDSEISISLAEVDAKHVASFRAEIQSTHPIRLKQPRGKMRQVQHSISVWSKHTASALARYGVVPNKSLTALPAKLSPELMPHYWRGVFDGDGSISSHKSKDCSPLWRAQWHTCLVGSMPMIESYSMWIRTICSATASVRKMTHSPVYVCAVTGRVNCAAVLSAMYAGSSISLERKRLLYEQVLADAAIDRRPKGYYAKLAG